MKGFTFGEETSIKVSFRDPKNRTADTKKKGLRMFLASEVMSAEYNVDFEQVCGWCLTYFFRFFTQYMFLFRAVSKNSAILSQNSFP